LFQNRKVNILVKLDENFKIAMATNQCVTKDSFLEYLPEKIEQNGLRFDPLNKSMLYQGKKA